MRRLLTLTLACFGASYGADLGEIKSVYLLPMSRGLDQYLAERLTSQQILQVVTDPTKADAIFTDRVGSNFEQSLQELYEPKTEAKSSDKVEDLVTYQRPSMQPLSRGKGNIFLVDRQTKNVIWSTFAEPPRTANAKDLYRIADQVSDRLAKIRNKKQKASSTP